MTAVTLKASGYTWRCPECGEFNYTGAAPVEVRCSKCNGEFEVGSLLHRHKKESFVQKSLFDNASLNRDLGDDSVDGDGLFKSIDAVETPGSEVDPIPF